MRGSALLDAWNRFFFAEQSPVPLACFRILYGTLVAATLLLLYPDWMVWYGPHAIVSLATTLKADPARRLDLLAIVPQSEGWIRAIFWLSLTSALLLAAGWLTRLNSILVFLCLCSLQQRNLFILHGGDAFLRIAGFFLMFAPAGAALSVDRRIRMWRGREGKNIRPRSPWAQRMIQWQLSLLYFSAFGWKLKGPTWVDGTALQYIYHVQALRRFPVPACFLEPLPLRLATWGAMGLELALGVLIWVPGLRYLLLALGLLFHLGLEYSLNIPLFQWDVLSAYVLFVNPADARRAWNWLRSRRERRLQPTRAGSTASEAQAPADPGGA